MAGDSKRESSRRLCPSGVDIMATSTRWPRTPVTRPAHSPSMGMRPSRVSPSSVKNLMAASRSSTTMPTLSIRMTAMLSPWRNHTAVRTWQADSSGPGDRASARATESRPEGFEEGDEVRFLARRQAGAEVMADVAIASDARVEDETGGAQRELRGAFLGGAEEGAERRHRAVVQVGS